MNDRKKDEKMTEQGRSVEKIIEIDAEIQKVWKAITDKEELERWFPLQAKVEQGVGGKIQFAWDDLYIWNCKITAWEENKYLQLLYQHSDDYNASNAYENDGMSEVLNSDRQLVIDYHLESKGNKTVLRLVHSGFGPGEDWDDMYDGVRRGWNQELTGLKYYLENSPGKNRTVVWTFANPKLPIETIWERLLSPNCLLFSGSVANLKEGGNYRFETPDGVVYQGKVLYYNPPQDFFATVENMGNTTIRVKTEKFGDKTEGDIWISSYDLNEEQLKETKQYWHNKFNELFPEVN